MLVGQNIGPMEVLMITLFGMVVATIAVILMMFFVMLLSRIFSGLGKNAAAQKAVPGNGSLTNGVLANTAIANNISEEEIAAITAAVCAESGLLPGKFRIVSISARQ
jgi:hypothetical protein